MIICVYLTIFILSIFLLQKIVKENYNEDEKMKVYCINRIRRTDRRDRFLETIKKSKVYDKLDIEMIDAVDKENIDKTSFPENLKPGEIGCYLSHLQSLMKLLSTKDKDQYALIFEDDAVCEEGIEQVLRDKKYKKYDILIIGHNYNNSCKDKQKEICEDIEIDIVHGAHAYLINKKGANKLLSKAFPITKPYDYFFVDKDIRKELKIGLLKNSICGVHNIKDTNTQ
jgi:glycosyl transferase family 25